MWHNTSFAVEPYGTRGLYLWQPLTTTAPESAQPWCCYIRTITFYDGADWSRGIVTKVGECDTEWSLLGQRWTDQDIGFAALVPFVTHDGQVYELASGEVLWRDGTWWKKWLAWRVSEDDRRLAVMRAGA